jgi:hypothetical protein
MLFELPGGTAIALMPYPTMRSSLRGSVISSWLRLALFCIAFSGAVPERSQAATLIVTSTADSGAGSLREAIVAAIDGDTIQFDAVLDGQTILLTSDELVIDKNIAIHGLGSKQLAVQRSTEGGIPAFRIFHVMPSHTVTIRGLTIRWGGADGSGHGVLNEQSTLTIDN